MYVCMIPSTLHPAQLQLPLYGMRGRRENPRNITRENPCYLPANHVTGNYRHQVSHIPDFAQYMPNDSSGHSCGNTQCIRECTFSHSCENPDTIRDTRLTVRIFSRSSDHRNDILQGCVRYGTGILGTGMPVVPSLPKCPVPVLLSYRTYRSVRYRY